MKYLLSICAMLATAWASAQVNPDNHYVNGYYKTDGTYVEGHYRTDPNNTVYDNYSTYPNINPYTGQQGTKYRYDTPTYTVPVAEQSIYGTGRVQQYQFNEPAHVPQQQEQSIYWVDPNGNLMYVP